MAPGGRPDRRSAWARRRGSPAMSSTAPCAQHARHLLYDVVTGHPLHRPLRAAGARHTSVRRFILPMGLSVATALAYVGMWALTDDSPNAAQRSAALVTAAERIPRPGRETVERSLATVDHTVTQTLDWIYSYGHWPVIALTLLWLASRHHREYVRITTAMLLTGAIGLTFFAVAPAADTGRATVRSDAYPVLDPTALVDQYATLPGLHVGLNLLITLAVLAATRKTWIRVAAVALTLSMDTAVVLTTGHLPLDAVAGVALAAVSWYAAVHLPTRRASPTAVDSASAPATAPARLRGLPRPSV
ncbi:hypothetical protein EU811_23325, partial [Arthrobacter sp. TS-15]